MSSGIVLMNKEGIAVASDSAVSLNNNRIIFHSYNKITQVGYFPLLVVHYDNFIMSNVPAELIFAQFDESMKNQKLPKPTLKHYMNEFIQFLEEKSDFFDFHSNQNNFLNHYFHSMINLLYANIETSLTQEDRLKKLKENVEKESKKYEQFTVSKNSFYWAEIKQDFPNFISKAYQAFETRFFQRNFKLDPLNNVDEQIINLIENFCVLTKGDLSFVDSLGTNICFVGYGNQYIYPSLIEIRYYGFFQGKVVYEVLYEATISDDYGRVIYTLGQDDGIVSLISGLDRNIKQQLKENLVKNSTIFFEKELKTSKKDKQTNQLISKFTDEVVDKIDEQDNLTEYTRKITNSISVLPLNDLASFAENLISIQIIRRKYETDKTTNGSVGGPIDLAVINKTEGVQWKKRK
jgi:hypothetical protein